ncbi:MAG: hypothetical protein CVV44_17750 [Spirochaetae bacterium HGW-Spirochaetae-1]|jgi:anti-sigma regulatory factor (Ser/Thr protein kinase)/PAS domain-containing protein|nr:MAG: hypothetical protein CVV44_17750 [Spirochaetae bacterium HGW-Spirochaetae-1]
MNDPIKRTFSSMERAYIRYISLFSIAAFVIVLSLDFLFEHIHRHIMPIKEHYLSPVLLIFTSLAALFLFLALTRNRIRKSFQEVDEELSFIELMKNHSNEIIILLDNLGRIVNHNTAFSRSLNIDQKALIGRPLREIFFLADVENDVHYRQLVLDKLKSAFMGIESELITTVFMKESRDIQTIHLKMKPVLKNKELHRIFVTGRFLQSDYITNKWLTSEKASYVLDNDLSLVHLFSYRLIRNLDGKIPRNGILYLQIALQETIINAIEHGNLEVGYKTKTELKQRGGNYWEFLVQQCCNDSILKRKVLVEYALEKDHVKYIITDEGNGFDWQTFMSGNTGKYSKNFLSTYHGVGLQMIKKSFDKIIFNDKGNQITLIKNIGGEEF